MAEIMKDPTVGCTCSVCIAWRKDRTELLTKILDLTAKLAEAKKKPEPTMLYINTDGMRRLAQSVKDGQGTRVGSMAKMLIDCCDRIDRLTAENKELTKAMDSLDAEADARFKAVTVQQENLVKFQAELKAKDEKIAKLIDALTRIDIRAKAYPLDNYPKPDLKKAHEVLKAAGMTLDAISADAIRHVLGGIKNIVTEALKENDE